MQIFAFDHLAARMGLALAVGLLFGLERGWRTRDELPGTRAAGIRTFAISGLLGGIVAAIAQPIGGVGSAILIGLGLAAYSAVMGIFCLRENRARLTYSATTWVSAVMTMALGISAVVGDMRMTAAAAIAATAVLASRETLHGWLEKLTWPELRSGIVLLAMTFVALPIMPAGAVGPYGGVNLRELWMIAIALAGVSFAGYVAVKYFGDRFGVLIASAAGGLVSSTAVAIANARRAAAGEGSIGVLAAGVAMASAVMFLRVGAIVLVVNPPLLWLIAPPLGAASIAALVFAAVSISRQQPVPTPGHETSFRNPFAFWSVLGFAVLLGVVLIAGRVVADWLGAPGAILGAILVGLVDVDAVSISLAQLAPRPLAMDQASIAILSAVASDTISKVCIGAAIGRGDFAKTIGVMAAFCLAAGGLAFWVVFAALPLAG